jgi:urea carboxylase
MIEVLNGGMYTSVQDYPGRVGYWNIGIPPSGPMDALALRIANRLVNNGDREAGLEITIMGPKLKFMCDTLIALGGAKLKSTLNGKEVPWWESFYVEKGSILTLGAVEGPGCRSYLAVEGGIEVPDYLGSKSTFPKGGFGGFKGRILKKGDFIRLTKRTLDLGKARKLASESIPHYDTEWEIGVIPGPHTAPDFFTQEDVEVFYSTKWRVHHNSNRLGYRLEGPRPKFAREDGGEGGRHPSNIHDYAYAIGTVNFTGDMPIILTVDGPSLGGFVSLATIITSELWKIGQAKPHNYIRFKKVTVEEAVANASKQEQLLNDI